MKTKDELIKHIADLRAKEITIQHEIGRAKAELAGLAEWRVGDVVETPKGTFKLSRVSVEENDGSVRSFGTHGHKQKKAGEFSVNDQYLYSRPYEWQLLERPEKKSD